VPPADTLNTARASSWADAFAAHKDAVYNAAFHLLGDAAAAEDVLQDVFVALVRSAEPPRAVRAWLLAAALNRVRDLARRPRRQRDADLDLLPSTDAEPVAAAAQIERQQQVARALGALPLEQREVVVLHAFEELSFAAIGELCAISPDTAASRWRYACDKLRVRLESVTKEDGP
jgi:RNA polymerase sigma-70 factor (ECF subfamily)